MMRRRIRPCSQQIPAHYDGKVLDENNIDVNYRQ
ncbi:MAG: hypothetical protein ACI8PP_000392 [Candidatus Pseudothioglobus sp.]|jgi:hypothetical protein